MIQSPHTRMPLWRGSLDNIVGVLHAKDLLRALDDVGFDFARIDVLKIASKPWFVPDTTHAAGPAERLPAPQVAFRHRRRRIWRGRRAGDAGGHHRGDRRRDRRRARRRRRGRQAGGRRLGRRRRLGADPRPQPRARLVAAGRRGDDDRRPGHPRDAVDPRGKAGLHLPRQALHRPEARQEPHHPDQDQAGRPDRLTRQAARESMLPDRDSRRRFPARRRRRRRRRRCMSPSSTLVLVVLRGLYGISSLAVCVASSCGSAGVGGLLVFLVVFVLVRTAFCAGLALLGGGLVALVLGANLRHHRVGLAPPGTYAAAASG